MILDAMVLAGGRSSRLSGVPKSTLRYHGTPLLDLAVHAASDAEARQIVVVGEIPAESSDDTTTLVTRENPPFGGPAAAIGAGIEALATAADTSDYTLVLACDLPEVGRAVGALLNALPLESSFDGVALIDSSGRRQHLTAVYRTSSITAAVGEVDADQLHGASVHELIGQLNITTVPAPEGSVDDIDTWADADKHGIARPSQHETRRDHG